jgi:hypothetical protein
VVVPDEGCRRPAACGVEVSIRHIATRPWRRWTPEPRWLAESLFLNLPMPPVGVKDWGLLSDTYCKGDVRVALWGGCWTGEQGLVILMYKAAAAVLCYYRPRYS